MSHLSVIVGESVVPFWEILLLLLLLLVPLLLFLLLLQLPLVPMICLVTWYECLSTQSTFGSIFGVIPLQQITMW
jgi:hypothetical protein